MLVGKGGLRGAIIVNKAFVNKLAFPILVLSDQRDSRKVGANALYTVHGASEARSCLVMRKGLHPAARGQSPLGRRRGEKRSNGKRTDHSISIGGRRATALLGGVNPMVASITHSSIRRVG